MNKSTALILTKIESMTSKEIAEIVGAFRDSLYGHVYVIEFEGGLFKIGKSRYPIQRTKYLSSAFKYAKKTIGTYVSNQHFMYSSTETQLLRKFSNLSGEYCSGIKIDDVINFLRELETPTESYSDMVKRIEDKELGLKKIVDRFYSGIDNLILSMIDDVNASQEIFDCYLGDNFEYCHDSEMYEIKGDTGLRVTEYGCEVVFYQDINTENITRHSSVLNGIEFIINNCFPKMLKKDQMSADMIEIRDKVLDDYIKLYEVIEDNSKVRDVLYEKYQPKRLETN